MSRQTQRGRPAWIESVATVQPEHRFDQAEAIGIVENWLNGGPGGLPVRSARKVFQHAGVKMRHSAAPSTEFLTVTDFGQKTDLYLAAARRVGKAAVEKLFRQSGVDPAEIDIFISVSCTGFVIPSIDAYLANEFEFRPDLKRLPITELGCAAGASALARAREYLMAFPDARAMVLSVEFPTLTFQPTDRSAAQIVSAALFGDGAAAVLLSGDDARRQTGVFPAIVAHETRFFPDTVDFMGYTNSEHGFHIMLSPEIPAFLKKNLQGTAREFLAKYRLRPEEIAHWIVHPGSARLLDIFADEFRLNGELTPSRNVLHDFGNLSSATILYVLGETMNRRPAAGERGLMVAFGPGFSAEFLLIEWRNPQA